MVEGVDYLEKCLNWRFRRAMLVTVAPVTKHGPSFLPSNNFEREVFKTFVVRVWE